MDETRPDAPLALLTEVRKYFGYRTLSEFKDDWQQLDDESRRQLRQGIGDGTFDYQMEHGA